MGTTLRRVILCAVRFEHEDEHSLSAVADALSCTPLKLGLASEARSTTALRRRRKHEDDFDALCEAVGLTVNPG